MMKEIHEQPKAVQDTLNSVIKNGAIDLSSVEITEDEIKNFEQIYIVACGSAWHVGMAAQYVLEDIADIPVRVELASEFRYRKMPLNQKALVIVVSQSGETADTLAALRLAKEKGITTMAIVNVVGSSIAREADKVFYTLAGPEISVATTKAYSAQLAAMYCLAVQFAKVREKITEEQYSYYISELLTLPEKMQKTLEDKERIQWFAAKYANAHDVFFVGRGIDYAVCLEGSLKLKEISYIHSEAYAAGELKHGTISLIEQGTLVIGVLTQNELYEKTISNMLECKSRGAYLMGLTTYGKYEIEDQVNFAVYVPKVDEHFMASLAVIPLQLLGYYVSVAKGLDVDKFDGKFFSYYAYMQAVELSKLERSLGGTVESVRIKKDELVQEEGRVMKIRGSNMTRVGAAAPSANKVFDVVEEMPQFAGGSGSDARQFLDKVQVRENMNETAFFYPALESDNNGNVAIRFTLPESVTTWKFMGLAHDKEMRNGLLVDEAVAQKTVMVQPNMPRFLREGDKSTIVVKLFNTSDKKVSGNTRMQILDPETNKVVWQKTQNYSIDAEGSATISFDVQGLKEGVYINKVVAAGDGYSDGEQHYLPVLSNRELVVNTLPITLHQKGEQNFDLSKLFLNKEGKQAKGAEEAKVTIEYTNNPSWLMVKALPAISLSLIHI